MQEVPGAEDGSRDARGDAELLQHQGTLHGRRPVPPERLEVAQLGVVYGQHGLVPSLKDGLVALDRPEQKNKINRRLVGLSRPDTSDGVTASTSFRA